MYYLLYADFVGKEKKRLEPIHFLNISNQRVSFNFEILNTEAETADRKSQSNKEVILKCSETTICRMKSFQKTVLRNQIRVSNNLLNASAARTFSSMNGKGLNTHPEPPKLWHPTGKFLVSYI